MFDPHTIKKDFPIFKHRTDLVYLDSAATAQKPQAVLEAMNAYYETYTANAARGLYPIAEIATLAVADARKEIATSIESEVDNTIFVGSATHGINLVATGLREEIHPGDNIVVTAIEHHSNFLPWKELAEKTRAEFRVAPVDQSGLLSVQNILTQLDSHTRVLALSAVSNVLGLINPVEEIITTIRKQYPTLLILVDACQAIGHIPVSVKKWDTDYLVFSGHKVFGPTGIGVLSGKKESLERLGAINVGGGTVLDPLSSPVMYKRLPDVLEGGTPNIAGIVGLAAAIKYIETLGIAAIHAHEKKLLLLLEKRLTETFGKSVHILGGTEQNRAGILSFTFDGIHPHDLAHLLGEENICIRAGEHCARPLHHTLHLPASARVSVSIYNTEEDIEKLMTGIQKALRIFAV